MDVGPAVVADGNAAELGEPRQCPLVLPSVTPEALAAVDTAPCDARDNATNATLTAAAPVVIALVGVEFVRSLARTTTLPADRRDRVEYGCQHPAVVPVGPAERQAER